MGKKRLTDTSKWEDPKSYFEAREFHFDKWIPAKGEDMSSLKEFPGCYCVFARGELVYIGQSNSPRFRMAQHFSYARKKLDEESPWGPKDQLLVKVKYPSKYGKEAMIEKRMIRRLQPRMNGQMKLRRSYRKRPLHETNLH